MTSNQPYSEQWRLAALDWNRKDAAARLLEESKSSVFSQECIKIDGPRNAAEQKVRASEGWADYIRRMVHARTAANEAKINAEFLKMRSWEHAGHEANVRAEMRL